MKKAVLVILLGTLLGIGVLELWVRWRINTERSPTVTTEIAHFKETLDRAMDPVTVKVFAIKKESTGVFDTKDIHSSRVEIEGSEPLMFSFALITSFAAGSARAIDLDQNGSKELLLYGEDGERGVVWIRERKLNFRPEQDLLQCGFLDSIPQDAGGGHMVFVVETTGVYTNGMHGVARRRVMAWTEHDGFRDVTVLFPKFVRKRVLVPLQKEMASEEDPERRKNFQQIIGELEELIKSPVSK